MKNAAALLFFLLVVTRVGCRCEEELRLAGIGACPEAGSRGPPRKQGGARRWSEMVHYHIAKNGGTTLRGILQARYDAKELHGPQKQEYSRYFHSRTERWRGRYFVAFARDPISKLLSQFYYARSELSGAFGRWHRCFDFGEYVLSRRARHNHQFSQLMTGQQGCGLRELPRPRHEVSAEAIGVNAICPEGLKALERRVAEVLSQPRLFVGIVERFDESLLALQRETGLPDVTYCPRRRHKNVLRVEHLPAAVVKNAATRNIFDNIVYNASLNLFRAKHCCYGITQDDLKTFRRQNQAFQQKHCPALTDEDNKARSRDRTLHNDTLGDPMYRAQGRDCDDMRKKRIGMTFFAPSGD